MSWAGALPSVAVWMTSPLVSSSRLLFDHCGCGGDGDGGWWWW